MQNSQQDSIKEIEKKLNEKYKKKEPLDTHVEALTGLHLLGVIISVGWILGDLVLLPFKNWSFSEVLDPQIGSGNVIVWLVVTILTIGFGIWMKQAKKDFFHVNSAKNPYKTG